MQTKGEMVQSGTNRDVTSEEPTPIKGVTTIQRLLPFTLLPAMVCAILLLDAVLPLEGFLFHTAILTNSGTWPLLPTHLLFPGWSVTSSLNSIHPTPPPVSLSWLEVPLLLAAFFLALLAYLFALRHLPRPVTTLRYILYSTLLLGFLCTLIPVVTSPDLFSYISYARIGVIYHLNPLTTLPTAISTDPVYVHLYWNNQPSAYGPSWAAITSLLQWITLLFGEQSLLPMVIALRIVGLISHLCSTLLIWSIAGQMQRLQGRVSQQKRILATLAFAWNPLLLFEACVNAHNDAVLLLFILLATWFLLPGKHRTNGYIAAMLMLALATCLKLNAVLLLPFFLIFIWKQETPETNTPVGSPLAHTLVAALTYAGTIILLYAPFWQHGEILRVFQVNPTTSRAINTLPEFFSHLYNSIAGALGYPLAPLNGSVAENVAHSLSIGIFVILYGALCWQAMVRVHTMTTLPSLVRWLALAWLLYCCIGTPWFWPWYVVTLFGLYALVEATSEDDIVLFGFLRLPFAAYLLAFSMLSTYCFYAWGPHDSFIPGLPGFQWAYLRGLWVWAIPLLAIRWPLYPIFRQRCQKSKGEPIEQRVEDTLIAADRL
jgi:hypothetical protein